MKKFKNSLGVILFGAFIASMILAAIDIVPLESPYIVFAASFVYIVVCEITES
jgi:hypothetical protein